MAMNKAEKQQLEDALEQVRIYKSFQITPKIEPDLQPPSSSSGFGAHIYGYSFNSHTIHVSEAWSEFTRNGSGHGERKHAAQNGIALYSTKLLALQAMRHEVAIRAARLLADIDVQIEQEKNYG